MSQRESRDRSAALFACAVTGGLPVGRSYNDLTVGPSTNAADDEWCFVTNCFSGT